MQSLDNGRLGIAAQAIGIARAALEQSLRYAAERQQFGKPIKEFQAIQFKLADMATRVAASRALLHAAAAAKDRGEPITQFGVDGKLFASETAMWVTTAGDPDLRRLRLREGLSGRAATSATPRSREIYEGTSEIQRIVIARELYARIGRRWRVSGRRSQPAHPRHPHRTIRYPPSDIT